MLGCFHHFFQSADFFKIDIFKKIFQEYHISVSNTFDPVQVRHIVGPDLGSNCM